MWQYLRNAAEAVKYAHWLTRERLLRLGAVCALMTIGLLVLDVAVHTQLGLTDGSGEHLGRDFFDFWSNTVLAETGRADTPYAVGIRHPVDQSLTYPPIVLLLWRPLASLSYVNALLVWTCLGLALCIWLLSRLIGWEMGVLAATAAPAAFIDIVIGQNGYYTAALLAWGLALVERSPVPAGIVLGTLCYKPQLAILLPVALAAGGYWRAFAAAAMWVVLLVTITMIVFGPEAWISFLYRIDLQRRLMEIRIEEWFWMPTVFAMIRLLGAGVFTAYAAQMMSAIAAAAAVAVLWRRSCPIGIKSAGFVVAIFLATPHAWDYDTVVLVFAAAWLANEGSGTGFRPWEKITVLVLLTMPVLSFTAARLLHLQIAPILFWLSLAVVMRRGLGLRFSSAVRPVRTSVAQSAA